MFSERLIYIFISVLYETILGTFTYMSNYYSVEIIKVSQPYLKIYVSNNDIEEILSGISSLPEIKEVDITKERFERTLTAYIYLEWYTPEWAKDSVEQYLEAYYIIKTDVFKDKNARKVEASLNKYPDIYNIYKQAKDKYEHSIYSRNMLDDMRLALELLLQKVLNNNKSLENQKNELGNYLNKTGCTKEISNMFIHVLECYEKYQNNHVKHKNNISTKDIDMIIAQTLIFMKRLLDEELKI